MKKGLRRVGIVGLSTLVATSMMSGLALTASATAGAYVLTSTPPTPTVLRGGNSQAAGSVSLDFANAFSTGDVQTFQIKPGGAANVCGTGIGVSNAIGFASAPAVTITGPFNAAGTAAGDPTSIKPTFTAALASSGVCAGQTIQDELTVTLNRSTASGSVAGDTFRISVGGVLYKVGTTAAIGPVALAESGPLTAPGSVNNATVSVGGWTVSPVVAAMGLSTGNTLGTATLTESVPGGFFPTGPTTVILTASGLFTAGVTPVITVPAGYSATSPVPVTTSSNTYTFVVTAPAVPVKATVSVAGLKVDAPAGPGYVTLDASVGGASQGALQAVNVLDYSKRTGGTTRYDTAAALFNSKFASATTAVLSSGRNFPDALSASFLAGNLAAPTGVLLTTPSTLSPAARTVITSVGDSTPITTVYITGQTLAVSQNVQNQIEAIHVGNVPTAAFVSVVRLGGQNRYATNQIMNEFTFSTHTTVLLASGQNFPDALALGAVAWKKNFPLILTKGSTLGVNENAQLSDFNPTNVVIAGGTLVVSQAIEDSLVAKGYTVLRLQGVTRTQTAAAIASWATVGVAPATSGTIKAAQGFLSNRTYIARGDDYPDALAAGPVAGGGNQLIVLSATPTVLGAGIPQYLGTKSVGAAADSTHVSILHALGLTLAMSNATMKEAAASVGP